MLKALSLLLCSLLLTACGFHLRGMIDLPAWLNNVAIRGDAAKVEFSSLTKSYLEGYHVRVNPDPTTADYWLIISNFNYQQQIVSIGASTNSRQYQLILRVDFLLQDRQGHMISPLRRVVVTRQLTVNNDRILGSNAEEHSFLHEMRQEAVTQMVTILCKSKHRP